MYKLRKIIRILDILIFNEGDSVIGTAEIDTVVPWLETLKDMERKITQYQEDQQDQHINGHHGHHGPSQLGTYLIYRLNSVDNTNFFLTFIDVLVIERYQKYVIKLNKPI